MNQTYDPILEITELRRVRTSLRSPEMGTALVLERATGNPVVVWPGERVPDARTGNYRRMFRVDTANRALSFTERVPSSHSAFRSVSPSDSHARSSARSSSRGTGCGT